MYRGKLNNAILYSLLLICFSLLVHSCSDNEQEKNNTQTTTESPTLSRSSEETNNLVEDQSNTRRIAIPKSNIDPDKKVALIIGNNEYRATQNIPPLKNPVNDAREMANTLKSLGFDVILKLDLSKDATIKALNEFQNKILEGAAVSLFYYAGHGLQYHGDNYIIPVTSIIESNEHVERFGVNFQELINRLENTNSQTNILIFDACRNVPAFNNTRSIVSNENIGLAQISTTSPAFIVYSTAPGNVALDGGAGEQNSPFAKALLKWIKEPGLKVEDVIKRVRRDVQRDTDNTQQPWQLSSLIDDFYFIPPDNSTQVVDNTDNFDQAYAYFNLGLEQTEANNYDGAIKTFSKVIDISPEYAEAYKERGTIYIKKKEFNKSLDDLDRALELKPDFAAALNNKGIVYSILGEYGTALEYYNRAIEIDKSFLKSYNNKARLYQIKGDNQKALHIYAQVLEINPNYSPAYNNRGLLYYSQQQYEKSIDDFTKAIENDSRNADAFHNRGIAYYYIGQNDKALNDYNNAIILDANNFKFYRDRAYLYEELGQDDKAKSDREIASKLSGSQ